MFDDQLVNFDRTNKLITTPVYPLRTRVGNTTPTVESSIDLFKTIVHPDDKVIFIVIDNIRSLYINYLMKFNKVPLEKLIDNVSLENAKMWNPQINAVSDLSREELRELLSIQFLDTVDNYLSAKELADDSWLTITTDDIINNFKETIESIFNYLNLERNLDENLDSFASEWQQKQQSIINKFEKIVNNNNYENISLSEEIVVHSMLVQQGVDIGTTPLLEISDIF